MESEHGDSSSREEKLIKDQMLATIYGQCVGDAIGLLTEFLTKEEAKEYYGRKPKMLLYSQKVPDFHRSRWKEGDWTDDTDQMILILQSILYNKGQVVATDFAQRIYRWMKQGFPDLGDFGGLGLGQTTATVLRHPDFKSKPHEVAFEVWDKSNRNIAPNGAVMRTSICGLHQWQNLESVVKNTLEICKCTHHDPRCQASAVAVSVTVALTLQHTCQEKERGGKFPRPVDVTAVIKQAYNHACQVLTTEEEKQDLWWYMNCRKLKLLQLAEPGKIGYTYKCMGAGFWAFKQKDFKKALIKIIMAGGDADTNGAVAGALLACKLGISAIPQPWIDGLVHKDWLMGYVNKFLRLQDEMNLPIEQRSAYDDLNIAILVAEDEERNRRREEEHKRQYEERLKNTESKF
ncbi:adpribosylglycohydrolase superfamily protein [Plakobranchus ocellatus]|uniref:Adpribosylglycohydrolase superfamily protein n=1 Tax=Plakobranchus ocellatus TaxID=259542 RepID=A0AAV4AI15_9GAST|nr:adpribosylglycohydrolase superfamily protein [Plakobranchus ocellatus]